MRVSSPPVEGAANDAVIRLVAAELGLAKSAVSIERGHTARVKLVAVAGVTSDSVLTRWPGLRLDGQSGGENDAGRR